MASIDVDIKLQNGEEDSVRVEIDADKYEECIDENEQMEYIKGLVQEKRQDFDEVNDEEIIEKVQNALNDEDDEPALHPNESRGGFLEHEEY